METEDILRKNFGMHIGYMPTTICKFWGDPKELNFYRKLERIPGKITAYFHRDKISLILSSDGTIFYVNY